jgi:hypothetical protein
MLKVISGFPGVGKTFYKENSNLNILDSDSSKFSWLGDRIRNPEFPNNYIKHIKDNMYKSDIILVSTHKIVRDALVDNNIRFLLVYPEIGLKEEYLKRFKDRGNDNLFIKKFEDDWDLFINEMDNQKGCESIKLKSGEYLSDVFKRKNIL